MMTVPETGICKRKHKDEMRSYDKQFNCDGCKEVGSGLRFRCDPRGHELHKECRSPSKHKHRSPSKHKHKYERRSYNKQFKCDGCKELGSGLRFRCDPCGRELHKECRFPKDEISHEFLGQCSLKFFKEPRPAKKRNCKECGRICNACGRDICGFNYHNDEKDWDLHPCCSNLKELRIDNTTFEIRDGVSSKCMRCREKNVGWSYVSRCGKHNFHVYCVWELLHEAADKDGKLTLENMNLHQVAKSRGQGRGKSKYRRMVKLFLQAILSILLGNPTPLFAEVLVELFT